MSGNNPFTRKSPIALFVYNRPDLTRNILQRICEVQPAKLFVIADGPKPDSPVDADKCRETRDLIDEYVNWDCELTSRYAERNLGCRENISTGLTWIFSLVDRAIILEDDCHPHPDFFRFCNELLERFKNNPSVGQICGYSPVPESTAFGSKSYLPSKYGPIWGWATWERAWNLYNPEMEDWPPNSRSHWLFRCKMPLKEVLWRKDLYNRIQAGEIDTWDYQWGYAKFKHGLLSMIPRRSLIENVGFGHEATHTKNRRYVAAAEGIDFPLNHPKSLTTSETFEKKYSKVITPGWFRVLYRMLRVRLRRIYHA